MFSGRFGLVGRETPWMLQLEKWGVTEGIKLLKNGQVAFASHTENGSVGRLSAQGKKPRKERQRSIRQVWW
jgi:hypothetical protein